jgi:bifunctional ADP-heptose synthase (sugar kinase/adenylyltransferase)
MEKILVIGELGTDVYVYGEVNRLSPEAPIPVLNPVRTVKNNGMAGNVVSNLKLLSPDSEIVHWHQTENITKTRYVHEKSNQMIIRVDEGELNGIQPLGFLSPNMKKTIGESDLVIISDYNKGYLTEEKISEIAHYSKICIVDTKKKLTDTILKHITFIKLNEIEFKNNQNLVENNLDKFIITLGSKGAKHLDTTYPSTNPQETIDVSGAGDTFVSAFSLMYLKNNNISESITFANEVCSDVVNKKGVSLPDTKFISRLTF